MKNINRYGIYGCILVAILCFNGCGDPKVTGTVKFSDGTPLKGGMVVLQNETSQGIGELDFNGSFNIYQYKPGDGLKRGKYRGYISGAISIDEFGRSVSLIPDKYADIENSGIEYDSSVNNGKLDIVIEK